MMSGWIESIRRGLKAMTAPRIRLHREVMIPRRSEIGDQLWAKLMGTLEPLVISRDDAGKIMEGVRSRIFSNAH